MALWSLGPCAASGLALARAGWVPALFFVYLGGSETRLPASARPPAPGPGPAPRPGTGDLGSPALPSAAAPGLAARPGTSRRLRGRSGQGRGGQVVVPVPSAEPRGRSRDLLPSSCCFILPASPPPGVHSLLCVESVAQRALVPIKARALPWRGGAGIYTGHQKIRERREAKLAVGGDCLFLIYLSLQSEKVA